MNRDSFGIKHTVKFLKFLMSKDIECECERFAFNIIFDDNIKEFFDSIEVDFFAAIVDIN